MILQIYGIYFQRGKVRGIKREKRVRWKGKKKLRGLEWEEEGDKMERRDKYRFRYYLHQPERC